MRIEYGPRAFFEVEHISGGVMVSECDAKGYVIRRDRYTDEEILAGLRVLQAMKDEESRSVFVPYDDSDAGRRGYACAIRNGDLLEYKIFD